MAKRLLAVATISALLTLHLGVACLGVMRADGAMPTVDSRSSMPMDDERSSMPMDDGRCGTEATAQQKLLCAAPSAVAAPTSQAPEAVAPGFDPPAVADSPSPLAHAAPPSEVRAPRPPGAPAFLLHHALLI